SMWAPGRLSPRPPFGRQDGDRAAELFHRRHRRFGRTPDREGELGLDLARAEQPDPVLGPSEHAGLHQRLGVDRRGRVELAGVDRRLDLVEIDLVELARDRRILEPPLGQPAVERHLAALEPLDAHARARGLPLAATAAGLARAGADAATDAAALLARARAIGEFVKFHLTALVLLSVLPGLAPGGRVLPASIGQNADGRDTPGHETDCYFAASTTRTKCLTLAIMPRVCGVSGNSATRPIRLRPSPINVSRCV